MMEDEAVTVDDAPAWFSYDEAMAWAQGYNRAIRDLEAL